MSSFTAGLIAFGVILLVELPDKTLVASLVLSTRYRPRPVLLGVALAFAVQCVIAGAAGGIITLLPRRAVEAVVALLFAIGAALLIKESLEADDDVELAEARESAPFLRIVATSFGVLFAAEWGDASQIATAGLVARHRGVAHAVATGLGAWLALVTVATIAVLAGRIVVRRVPLRLVHRVAGVLFAAFAVLAAVAAMTD
ncbi:MAG: Ca2+/H+ antiporter, family [Pseudonocardiales bacterium]|jgi:putative Ca2+/H+ antiporter (TMEM165/GDT1 family)|nr:Ca2+/H+ antiporter, family [Pseudonocardiales bacterium]